MQVRSLAVASLFFFLVTSGARAQGSGLCAGACADLPIEVLVYDWTGGRTTFLASQLAGQHCSGEPCGVSDFNLTGKTPEEFLLLTEENLCDYDVVYFPTVGIGGWGGSPTDAALMAANYQSVLRDAHRAFVSGIDELHDDDAFRNLITNSILWAAEDECGCPGGECGTPGVVAWSDQRTSSGTVLYSYLPWPGVRTSAKQPAPACSNSLIQYDDVTLLDPAHPVLGGLNADPTADCAAAMTDCSLDDSRQSVHMTWEALQPGGYETHGFTSIFTATADDTACFMRSGVTCQSTGEPWPGIQAGLVRDEPCCQAVPEGLPETYLPFFREDGHGTNKPGAILALTNHDNVPVWAVVEFYECDGTRIPTQNAPLPGGQEQPTTWPDAIAGNYGNYWPVKLEGNGNDMLPPNITTSRFRLRDILSLPAGNLVGTMRISTVESVPVGQPIDHRVHAELFQFSDGNFINTPDGYAMLSQFNPDTELFIDFFFALNNGTTGNPTTVANVRNFTVLQNPSRDTSATFTVNYFDRTGAPIQAVSGTIPPDGCWSWLTNQLTGDDTDPCKGGLFEGNGIVQVEANVSDGAVQPIVGASVWLDGGSCGSSPGDQVPDTGKPVLAVDTRDTLRK